MSEPIKLKGKQKGHKCSWCNQKATHRTRYFSKLGCADHMSDLRAAQTAILAEDIYQTEAERLTS